MIDDDDYEDDDYETLLAEEQWENDHYFQKYKSEMPDGWAMIKINTFSTKKLEEIDKWCEENCSQKYNRVGWRVSCSSSHAMQFESPVEAAMFKLSF